MKAWKANGRRVTSRRGVGVLVVLLGLTVVPVKAGDSPVDGEEIASHVRQFRSRDATASRELPLPTNLIVPDVIGPLVGSMWRKSPTFRRQCARLAEHPDVIVRLEFAWAVRGTKGARSLIKRHHGGLTAVLEIEMRKPALYLEHIAHELEHVLEYVDGTDLPRLAHQGLDGVVNRGGRYETARAQSVGRTVAREVMTP